MREFSIAESQLAEKQRFHLSSLRLRCKSCILDVSTGAVTSTVLFHVEQMWLSVVVSSRFREKFLIAWMRATVIWGYNNMF